MDLNQLSGKLFKAEMMNDIEKIEHYKRQIEEFKKNQPQSSSQTTPTSSSIRFVDNELNVLNAKLLKAEMLGDQERIQKCKDDLENYKKTQKPSPVTSDFNETANGNKSQNSHVTSQPSAQSSDAASNPLSVDLELEFKRRTLTELKVKLRKAELTRNDEQIKLLTEQIDVMLAADKVLAKKEEKAKKAKEIDLDEVFYDLVMARKVNDRKKMDACEEKIAKFEYQFNFKNKADLEKMVKISSDVLIEAVKTVEEEKLNGNKELVKDLDRKTKAIRKKVIEYEQRLDEFIKSTVPPDVKPKVSHSLRIDPRFGPYVKNERDEPPEPSDDQESPTKQTSSNTRTVRMVRRVHEDKMSLQQMFVSERAAGTDSEDARFVRTSSRIKREDEEYDGSAGASAKRKKTNEAQQYVVQREQNDEDEECDKCLSKLKSQLLVECNDKLFVCIPEKDPLIDSQMIIRSLEHCSSLVEASEDVFELVVQYKYKINSLFQSIGKSVIFVEQYIKNLKKWNRHFEINCYPIDEALFDEARICFTKELSDVEGEWSLNKKIIHLTNEKPLNKSIPKELSYFCVTFGSGNSGFAHVIEDYRKFSKYFGQEVIGGLLDINPQRWIAPGLQNYDALIARLNEIKKLWSRLTVSSR